MSDTDGSEQDGEADGSKLIPFAEKGPFDDRNKLAALLARMDAAFERSRASLLEYKAIIAIVKRDYTARDGGDEGTAPGDNRMEDEEQ